MLHNISSMFNIFGAARLLGSSAIERQRREVVSTIQRSSSIDPGSPGPAPVLTEQQNARPNQRTSLYVGPFVSLSQIYQFKQPPMSTADKKPKYNPSCLLSVFYHAGKF